MRYLLCLLLFMGCGGYSTHTNRRSVARPEYTPVKGERGPAGEGCFKQTVEGEVVDPRCVGARGERGESGPVGPQGPAGTPGTSVVAVQFCPNRGPASYPSSFPEVGFCIGGKLYATYWDGNQAWSAEIPPGTYSSTATSLGCSFTVGASCAVTQLP